MVYRSVKSRLKGLGKKTSLDPIVKGRIRERLEFEMMNATTEAPRKSRFNFRRKLPVMAAVVVPLVVIAAGVGYWQGLWLPTPRNTAAVGNNTTTHPPVSPKSEQQKSKYPTLRIGVSRMTSNAGSLSNFLHGVAIRSHSFPGSSGTDASVLASVDGDGTLVAVNLHGDGYLATPGLRSMLYFMSAKSNKVQTIAKLSHDGSSLGVVTAAVLSPQWIAWTDYVPNGVMQNLGILNRVTGKSWYIVPSKKEQTFLHKGLGGDLFLRGNTLYMQGMKTIQSYNILTKKWSTFYSPPTDGNLQLQGFELTDEGAVVELSGGTFDTDTIAQLNRQGRQVGTMYHLPQVVYSLTGVSGNTVILDGGRDSYMWTPGTSAVQEITTSPGWFSGVGGRYATGWDYSQQNSGQLLDLRAKLHYNFQATSAVVTGSTLYWTKGNTLYWAPLPK